MICEVVVFLVYSGCVLWWTMFAGAKGDE